VRDPGCKEDRDEQDPTDQDDHVHGTPPTIRPGASRYRALVCGAKAIHVGPTVQDAGRVC
jgi:hypothetical protein